MASMRFPKVSPNSQRALAIEIRNEMSGGIAVDDSKYSIRHIESEIRHVHGQVQYEIDKQNEREGILPDSARERIFPCLKLEDTKDFYCKCTDSDGKFKKVVLPVLYKWRNQSFISYFGNTEMSTNFVPTDNVFQMNALPILTKRPAFFMINNIAYVSLPKKFALACEVTVIAIPANPNETNGKCFDPWNTNWNIDEYIKATIKNRVKYNFSQLLLQTAQNPDFRNNANDGNIVPTLFGQ